jgi:hypothetical protein
LGEALDDIDLTLTLDDFGFDGKKNPGAKVALIRGPAPTALPYSRDSSGVRMHLLHIAARIVCVAVVVQRVDAGLLIDPAFRLVNTLALVSIDHISGQTTPIQPGSNQKRRQEGWAVANTAGDFKKKIMTKGESDFSGLVMDSADFSGATFVNANFKVRPLPNKASYIDGADRCAP